MNEHEQLEQLNQQVRELRQKLDAQELTRSDLQHADSLGMSPVEYLDMKREAATLVDELTPHQHELARQMNKSPEDFALFLLSGQKRQQGRGQGNG